MNVNVLTWGNVVSSTDSAASCSSKLDSSTSIAEDAREAVAVVRMKRRFNFMVQ
jgi:hypothetical protein